jgi:hypothetical protein
VDDIPPALGKLGSSAPFLVETFISGREYSAEGICTSGAPQVLAITEKFTTDSFVEIGHRVPAGLDNATAREARATVELAVSAVGITRGIFHVEFWITENGIILGELHARPGGDFIHALVEHSRPGLELYGTLIDDLLNRDSPAFPKQTAAAGVEYLILPPGRVRSIQGWDTIPQDQSVIAAHLEVRPGDPVHPVASSADRHGVVVVEAPTRGEVDAVLSRLTETFHIDITLEGHSG